MVKYDNDNKIILNKNQNWLYTHLGCADTDLFSTGHLAIMYYKILLEVWVSISMGMESNVYFN